MSERNPTIERPQGTARDPRESFSDIIRRSNREAGINSPGGNDLPPAGPSTDEVVLSGIFLTWENWFEVAFRAWMAFLTVGICFGVVIGLGVALVMWWFHL